MLNTFRYMGYSLTWGERETKRYSGRRENEVGACNERKGGLVEDGKRLDGL
jgi:hypothetical protein